ncbi:BREX-5 system adenine-specific DNA-methyltransferase PglX [Haloplanus rubicundus]|uniref:site-specific DNA-methyltransferase (adenine-specific) n=1 Tax=Haloplanus rubicundus TaxID=1547898 RepID=A0A345E9Y0_9EURY|nr:BREX-5 system adenine-specific DNA-methyltransferase PglX [Haloplanus rubicundus]AXG09002.1 BREX-5 system adenine-specific DNA-methyltransferase PglX [Haloplanus rubicundus]
MAGDSRSRRTAQLDKAEREHLDAVVEKLRERAEDNVRYQLTRQGLDDEPVNSASLDADLAPLVEAIELERADGDTWTEAFEQYVTGVGYTVVNRLAALRCLDVREFVDEAVTVFKANGLTPAAERLVHEAFLPADEATLEAYHDACDDLADEIGILFDRESAYSLVDPDADTFEELCGLLDEVPDAVWRADDVLGWVYEYYNRPVVEAIDARNTLEPDDVGPANQFYTPHWVVRMLADNSLGKLYLEATGREDAVPEPDALSPEARKERLVTPDDAPTVAELCTYLIPDGDGGDAPSFDHPSELRVLDPACGSGHFLLYAFDILERIWWAETDLDRREIPAKILEHNLYGVDIDLRSCKLSAFNLYLKARTRAEKEGGAFEMPNVGIVCADARVADVEAAIDVLDRIAGDGTAVREALDEIVEAFRTTPALGSLLDVQGTLSEAFVAQGTDAVEWGGDAQKPLNGVLRQLRDAVDERTADSFDEQHLRSFLHLLVVLTQDYDVALMNPPYGARGRMPSDVTDYVEEHYRYGPEYYVNFVEACDRLSKRNGRLGMIVQRSFMYKRSFREFREDFIGQLGAFDFLAEYGIGVLDKATVRTAGTVIRTGRNVAEDVEGLFYRLHDPDPGEKQDAFLRSAFTSTTGEIQRQYRRKLREFERIPGSPLSYWASTELRSLYEAETVFDAENGNVDRDSLGVVKQGLATADDARFTRHFWETHDDSWRPFAKGGEDAWTLPSIDLSVLWGDDGTEIKRYCGSRPQNTQYYFGEALTYTYMKSSGRRFGYLHPSSIFGHAGNVFVPNRETWKALAYANSHLVTYLMLCQTPERHWEVGNVSKLPWPSSLAEADGIVDSVEHIAGAMLATRQYDPASPHYEGPPLLDGLGDGWVPDVYTTHPHRRLTREIAVPDRVERVSVETPIRELGAAHRRREARLRGRMEASFDDIERTIRRALDLGDAAVDEIRTEVALRTNETPCERDTADPESITDPGGDLPEMVTHLLLHLTHRIVHEADDGIVPISDVGGEPDLLARLEREFERIWGPHAPTRLAEVDRVLGSRTADEAAYPNLRAWLEDDLFDAHVSTFDRTPILWRLTTERLVSDPEGEGFACLVDYHQLDSGVFDRLQNRYLEPRKALLRERRRAANRRRGDDSLSACEKAAADEYTRCESGLEQIAVFEERLAELARPSPREWPEEKRRIAADAVQSVAEFREDTAARLETLEELADRDDVEMDALFSPSFYETVQENREEWLDALDDLQSAFEAYAADGSVPVEAHRYDLFEYYDDLVGSTHYASNGILFTTYYFGTFEDTGRDRLGDGGVSERERLLSELATGLDEYEDLADGIAAACDAVASDISAEWADRALSEITTAGYQPNRKHGVEINIRPLADAKVVPETVEDDVL